MIQSQKKQLSYAEVRKLMQSHALRLSEIPIEHSISMPMPTKRWNRPAYAFFASPALRSPGKPMKQGPPDRWWLVDPHGSHIMLYALWEALPYTDEVGWNTVILPQTNVSIAEQKDQISTIELLMDTLIPAFFADQQGETGARQALVEALTNHLPELLLPQYQALTPDFFAWLKS